MSFSAGSGANKRVTIEFIGNDTSLTSTLTRVDRNLKTTMESGKVAVTSIGTAFQTSAVKAETFSGALQTMNTRTPQLTGALTNMATSTNTTSTSFGALNNAIKETNTFQGSVVSSANKATDSIGDLGDAGEKTGGKMSKLKEAFSGNRGLIYSMGTIFGTMTGVVAELQLLEDANGQVAEATEKLNKLQEEGKQGTQEYSQAQQQLEKANRFLGFTTRNLSLAFANFVPEILLLATNLSRSEGLVGKITGAFGRLKGSTTGVGGALSSVGTGATAASGGLAALSASLKGFLAVAAPLAGVGATIAAIALSFQRAGADIKLASGDMQKKLEGLQEFFNGWKDIPVLGPILEALIKPLGILPQITVKAADGVNQLSDATKTAGPNAKVLADAQADLAAKTKIYDDAVKSGMATHKMYNDVVDATTKVNQILGGTYSELNGTIDDNRDALLKNNGIWIDFGTNVKSITPGVDTLEGTLYKLAHTQSDTTKTTQPLEEQLAHLRDTTGTLNDPKNIGGLPKKIQDVAPPMTDLNKITQSVTQSYDQFIESINVGIPAEVALHQKLLDLAAAYPEITNAAGLTNDELEEQITKAARARAGLNDLGTAAEQAAEDFNKFLKSATENEAKTRALDAMYAQLGQTMIKGLNPSIALTQEDLTKLGKTFKDGESTSSKLADIINEKLAPSFQVLSDVLDADTFKDFKKNFKDLNLDKLVGKDLEKSLQKSLAPLSKLNIKSKDVEELFSVLVQGGENLSDVDWNKATGKLATNLEKLGKIDPDAASEPMKKIFESVKTMTPEQLQQHAKSFDYLFKAMKGGLTKEEAQTFQEMFNKENAGSIGTMGTNAGVAAPKLDAVASALDSVNLAAKDVADKMSKLDFEFAPPKLDEVAQALKDVEAAANQTAKKISQIKYKYPAPDLGEFANALKDALKAAQDTGKKISKIKYKFPEPDLSDFAQALKDALAAAKDTSKKISGLNTKFTVTKVEKTVKQTVVQHGNATIGGGNANEVMGGNGMINITLINTDEYGEAKKRKFKASMGKESYRFGT